MTINKVIFGGETLVDLTNDTVTPDKLAKGVTAHDKTGVQITGTMESGGGSSLYCGVEDTNHVLQYPIYNLDYPTVEYIQPAHFKNLYIRGGVGDYKAIFSSLKTVPKEGFVNAFINCKISAFDFSSVTTVEKSGFNSACQHATFTETDISFPALTVENDGLYGSFAYSNITKLSFPSLVQISGSMTRIASETTLSEVEFPNLTIISGEMDSAFSSTLLTTLSFPKLKTITDDAKMQGIVLNCQNLTQLHFPVLESLGSLKDAFGKCPLLTSLSFPKLTKITAQNAFEISSSYPSYATNTITELHFGAANQAAIEASPGYATLWGIGAGKATVYFDL